MTNFFERLMYIAQSHGIKTPNQLAVKLNYKSPEKLYRLQRDKNAQPSLSIIIDIANLFAQADLRWILTGKKSNTPYVSQDVESEQSYSPPYKSENVPPTTERCKLCVEKERVIEQQQVAIEALKEANTQLRHRLEEKGVG